MTQQDLAKQLRISRTKINMALSLGILPDDLKKKIIEVLDLPADTFLIPANKELDSPLLERETMQQILDKMNTIAAQQKQIMNLLRFCNNK